METKWPIWISILTAIALAALFGTAVLEKERIPMTVETAVLEGDRVEVAESEAIDLRNAKRIAGGLRTETEGVSPRKKSPLIRGLGRRGVRNKPVTAKPFRDMEAVFKKYESGGRLVREDALRRLVSSEKGDGVEIRLAGVELKGEVDSTLETEGSRSVGIELEGGTGRMNLTLSRVGRLQGAVFFNGSSDAFFLTGYAGERGWKVQRKKVSDLLCTPLGSVYPPFAIGGGAGGDPAPVPLAAVPVLESLPGASHVVYCDFDGEAVTHPWWNNGAVVYASAHAQANNVTFVTNVWKRVMEDFSPFAINVTTSREVFDAVPENRRVHCIITPTDTVASGSGGVAWLDSFGTGNPCWVFNGDEYSCADTISHEVGHTLGLQHDGQNSGSSYYGGHGGSGPVSWAPIMGAAWANANNEAVTQWSRGEYPDANNAEDDLQIIASGWGFGFRTDDYGNGRTSAEVLNVVGSTIVQSGLIEQNADADYFRFSTTGGTISVQVDPLHVASPYAGQAGANLAVAIELQNSGGSVLQSANPTGNLGGSIVRSVPGGTYYLKVSGAGRGSASTGFTSYASLGQYSVSGTIPGNTSSSLLLSDSSENFDASGGTYEFAVSSNAAWSWSDDASWVTSLESFQQSAIQSFTYQVAANGSASIRNATITFTTSDGTVARTHTISQEGVETADDHGDSIDEATAIAGTSTTPGEIEEAGDEDYFRITLATGGALLIQTTGTTDTYGYLLDASGNEIVYNDDSGEGYNFQLSTDLAAGIYYLRVRHFSTSGMGSYILSSGLSGGADDHGNTRDFATPFSPNSTSTGTINFGGDEDFFRLEVPESGSISLQTAGGTDTYGYLLDESGGLVESDDDDGEGRNFLISREIEAGTYFVRVRHYSSSGTGDYELQASFEPRNLMRNFQIARVNGQLQLRMTGDPNHIYLVQHSTNLEDWNFLANVTTDSSGNLVFNVPPSGLKRRVFRIADPAMVR